MFRFTIRELVLLTLVVAMGIGWALECRHRGPENTRLREQNQKLLDMRQYWLSENQRLEEERKKMLAAWLSVMQVHNEQSVYDAMGPQRPSLFTGLRPVPGRIDDSPLRIPSEWRSRYLWREYPELLDDSDSNSPRDSSPSPFPWHNRP
jgi:hypothetical protein